MTDKDKDKPFINVKNKKDNNNDEEEDSDGESEDEIEKIQPTEEDIIDYGDDQLEFGTHQTEQQHTKHTNHTHKKSKNDNNDNIDNLNMSNDSNISNNLNNHSLNQIEMDMSEVKNFIEDRNNNNNYNNINSNNNSNSVLNFNQSNRNKNNNFKESLFKNDQSKLKESINNNNNANNVNKVNNINNANEQKNRTSIKSKTGRPSKLMYMFDIKVQERDISNILQDINKLADSNYNNNYPSPNNKVDGAGNMSNNSYNNIPNDTSIEKIPLEVTYFPGADYSPNKNQAVIKKNKKLMLNISSPVFQNNKLTSKTMFKSKSSSNIKRVKIPTVDVSTSTNLKLQLKNLTNNIFDTKSPENKNDSYNNNNNNNNSNLPDTLSPTNKQTIDKALKTYKDMKLKTKCQNVFYNFAEFSIKNCEFYISYFNMNKIFKAIGINENNYIKNLDLFFQKINIKSKKFNLDDFLALIVVLAESFYSKEIFLTNPTLYINKFVDIYFEPVIILIKGSRLFFYNKVEESVKTFKINTNTLHLLEEVYFGLQEIYSFYFKYEINNNKNKEMLMKNSVEALADFGKDFEIMPYLINLNHYAIYWKFINEKKYDIQALNQIIDNNRIKIKDVKLLGRHFKFTDFCIFLLILSQELFEKFNKYDINNCSNEEKLLTFLEFLSKSKGIDIVRLNGKNLPNFNKNSLLPSIEIIANINPKFLIYFNIVEDKRVIKVENKKNKECDFDKFREVLEVTNTTLEWFLKHVKLLFRIYQSYCKKGEKLNNNINLQLGYSGFFMFLKDYGLDFIKKTEDIYANDRVNERPNIFPNDKNEKRVKVKEIKQNIINNSINNNNNTTKNIYINLNNRSTSISKKKYSSNNNNTNTNNNNNNDKTTIIKIPELPESPKLKYDTGKFKLQEKDISLLFTKALAANNLKISISKVKSTNKIDFINFIKILERISSRIYLDIEISIDDQFVRLIKDVRYIINKFINI